MLTAKNVTSLPVPQRGQKDYPDEGMPGFSLRVSASGRRVYTLYYRIRDSVKKRRATLGTVGQVSLADARQRARELLRDISLGSDPLSIREMDEVAVLCERFKGEFCSSSERSKYVREAWPRLIDKYVLPAIGHMKPIDRAVRARIVEFTDAIARTGKGYMANRIFEITRRIWTWGIEKAVISHENYPFLRLKKPFQHESRRKRFYNTQEIRDIWAAIEYQSQAPGAHPDGSRVAEGYFKMLWYTAARRGEVARMRFDAIDFDKHQWVLYDTKNDEPLVLPLPRQAMEIIDGLRPVAEERHLPFVFFSVRPDARQGHLDPTSGAPASRIRARSGVSDFRPHDIRRTVRTNLAEMGVGKEVAEAILNHVQDKMSETYNRHRYQSQMGEALQRWADRLDQIVRAGKAEVVNMGARR
jgi:integrase